MPTMVSLDGDDHVMGDDLIIDTTETIMSLQETLDPSKLALTGRIMSLSPDIGHEHSAVTNGHVIYSAEEDSALDGDVARQKLLSRQGIIATSNEAVALPYASSRTGLVYDSRMRFHVEPIPKDQEMHPEDPRRIYEVYMELLQAGLIDDPANPDLVGKYVLLRIPARFATKDEICAVHSDHAYEFVMALKG